MKFAEKVRIAQRLQNEHYAFRVFWDMSDVVFNDHIDTICVSWNRETFEPTLVINEGWWREMDETSQTFAIMHECFHVLFNHVRRFADSFGTEKQDHVNVATDIVINEMLTNKFGFDRDKLHKNLYDPNAAESGATGCWIDTVFGDDADDIEQDKATDYYLEKLLKLYPPPPEMGGGGGGGSGENQPGGAQGFDVHIVPDSEDAENLIEALDQSGMMEMLGNEFKEKVSESEESGELESKGQLAGTGSGNWLTVEVAKVKIKQKWETVVRNYSRRLLSLDITQQERWDRIKPLYYPMINGSSIKLPFESWMIGPVENEKKGLIYMFLDCSGSCIHLKDRFFKAARTVDPRKIDLRLFSFDTSTRELDIKKQQVHGGGGTCFRCIEEQIQEVISKEKTRYPDQVFVVTDGYGTPVSPEKADRWIWFLTDDAHKGYIPDKSKVHYLKDFE